jgi:hypothetical protein
MVDRRPVDKRLQMLREDVQRLRREVNDVTAVQPQNAVAACLLRLVGRVEELIVILGGEFNE